MALDMRLIPVVLFCVLTSPAIAIDKSGVAPETLSLPKGPGSIEGLGPSFEPMLNTGAANYSVPLQVPPGVNGHQPNLAFQYNSGLGNGQFGIGWTLGLARIQRQTDKGQPSYDQQDTLEYSNGEELVPLADGTWRCENETAFMRFERAGDGWEVRQRGGRVYRIGRFPDTSDPSRISRIENPAAAGSPFDRTYQWFVDQIEDSNGNQIDFFYEQLNDSPGQLYLSEIQYNRHGDVYNAVTFDYDTREDVFRDYRPGFRVITSHRGHRVRMWSHHCVGLTCPRVLVREYRLEYQATADEVMDPQAPGAVPLAISLLSKVTQYSGDGFAGGSFLPPLRFGYTRLHLLDRDHHPTGNFPGDEDVDLNGNGVLDGPNVARIQGAPLHLSLVGNVDYDFLDVDADGLPDVISAAPGAHVFYRNLGRGVLAGATPIPIGGTTPGVPLSAPGAAMADMDADGFADYVASVAITGGMTYWRNRADGTWAPSTGLSAPPVFPIGTTGARFFDVDFNKTSDLVRSHNGSSWEVCALSNDADIDHKPFDNFPGDEDVDHNGNGLTDGAKWSCRFKNVPFTSMGLPQVFFDSPAADVQLADMNGDRIQDVVYLQRSTDLGRVVWVWFHRGNLQFDPPVVMSAEESVTGALVLGDPLPATTNANLRLTDVTGDGLSDLVHVRSGSIRFWVNLGGDHWATPFDLAGTPPYSAADTALRFVDLNGNGSTDILWARSAGPASERWKFLDLSPDPRPGQLKIIDNGIGRRTTIRYRSSIEELLDAEAAGVPWSVKPPFSTQVVSQMVTTPSMDLSGDGQPDRYLTDFAYRDGYYDPYEREFRGFAFVKKIERGDSDAPTRVSRIFFHTGAPDGLDNDGDGRLDERTARGGSEEEALKGRTLRQEITIEQGGADTRLGDGAPTPDAVTFSRTVTDWTIRQIHSPSGGSQGIPTLDLRNVSFAHREEDNTQIVELGATPIDLRTTYEYDDFGNQTLERKYGVVGSPGDERFTFRQFIHDTNRWIVDRNCTERVEGASANRITETRRYYDGADFVGGALCSSGLAAGNLTREEKWIEDSNYIQAGRFAYDTFGNKIAVLDPLGVVGQLKHRRDVAYDTVFHTFPVRETLHVGDGRPALVMNAAYKLGFGVMTRSIDFNGNAANYGYDAYGRLTSTIKPGDSAALPTEMYEYRMSDPFRGELYDYDAAGALALSPSSPTASSVTTRLREEEGQTGTFDVVNFVDGLGRELATIEEDESGFVVANAVRFNGRATVREVFQPYRSASAGYSLPVVGPTRQRTIQRYDATGRLIETVNPEDRDGQVSSVSTVYEPLARAVFDENGNETKYLHDGLERLVEVQETNLGERYVTRYTYNPVDSLLQITDAQLNERAFEYDGLQRRTSINDPNRGITTHVYDDASNMIERLDAKGQRITNTYDGLNRLKSEDYHDTGLPFSYDRSPDVTYTYDVPTGPVDLGNGHSGIPENTAGFLTGVVDLSGEEHVSYDARGRVGWRVKRLVDPAVAAAVSFKTEMTYDSMDRVRDLIYPDGDRVQHVYNRRNKLEQIAGGPSGFVISNVNYRTSGQLERIDYGNGIATDYI